MVVLGMERPTFTLVLLAVRVMLESPWRTKGMLDGITQLCKYVCDVTTKPLFLTKCLSAKHYAATVFTPWFP
jgi:hypothetical protein